MNRSVGLAAAAAPLALVALVSPAAAPGPVPPAPLPASAPGASPSPEPDPAAAAEVQQLLTDLDAVDTDKGLVLPLPEQVLFDFNSADLRPDAEPTLAKVAQLIGFYTKTRVEFQGYTDDIGDDDYNLRLSELRAAAVRDRLRGASETPELFVATGFGETRPVAPNDSDDNRQRNRRVEVVLVGT